MKLSKLKLILIIISFSKSNLCDYPQQDSIGILILSPSHIASNNNNSNNNNDIRDSESHNHSKETAEQRNDNNWEAAREEDVHKNTKNENFSESQITQNHHSRENETSRIESLYEKEFNLQSTVSEPTALQKFQEADKRFEKTYARHKNQAYTKEINRMLLFQRLYFHEIDLNKKMEYGNYPKMIHFDFWKVGEFGDKGRSREYWNEFSKREKNVLNLFCNFNLYYIQEYRDNLKQLPSYDFFITKIAQNLGNSNNEDFFNATKNRSLSLKNGGKIKFHDFIFKEAHEIQQRELNKFNQKSKDIEKAWLEKPKNTFQKCAYNPFNKTLKLEQILNKEEIIKKDYALSPTTQLFLNKHSIDINQFEQFTGNQLQNSLHHEFLYVIERAASIWHESQNNKNIQDFALTTAHFANIGCNANNNGSLELANNCADTGHCLLAFFEGCKNAIIANSDFLKNLLIHPIQTGKEIIKTIKEIGKTIFPTESAIAELARDVIFAISKVFIQMQKITNGMSLNQINPENLSSSLEKIKIIHQDLLEHEVINLKEKVINVLHQNINNFVPRFDTQVIVPILVNVGTNITDKIINADTTEKFEVAGYLITDATLNFIILPELILKPLGTIGIEATKLINLGLKKGAVVTLEAIELIKQNPKLINIATTVNETIENVTNLKQYYVELIKYEKLIASNERLKRFLKNAKIPEFFIPAESIIKRLELVKNEEYFIDILGNKLRVSTNPNISEIELSGYHVKTFYKELKVF